MLRFVPRLAGTKRLVLALLLVAMPVGGAALAQSTEQADQVDRARIALNAIRREPNLSAQFEAPFARARAVLIFPSIVKGGFFVGGERGNGVLLTRAPDGGWAGPAFFTLTAASFGLQFGGTISQAIFLIMNDGALEAILTNAVKLGADLGIAVGTVGATIEGSTTTNIGVDILSFALSKGLFGGVAFEGAVIRSREDDDFAYYGRRLSARDIIADPSIVGPGAEALRQVLATPGS